jgi:alkylation response protein AidB-like acyl-CoA dehydrogenase
MTTMTKAKTPPDETCHWADIVSKLGTQFEKSSAQHDEDDSFVADNYEALKAHNFLAAAIPKELGGGGLAHSEMCDMLRLLGQSCSSTALAQSMHQHLLAAMIWKYHRGQGGEETLRKIAENQPVLVSTGARDWLESNGEVERVKGGYRVTARKHFASQSAHGDLLVTSAPFEHPDAGWKVLHFSVPFAVDGLSTMGDWMAMGMRGTGSHTVKLENVFVPEGAVTLERPQGEFHPFWNVILTVALPLVMGAYLGIAQKAAHISIEAARKQKSPKAHLASAIGAMNNELTTAELNWMDMVKIANNLDFEPHDEIGHQILTRKTNVAKACIGVVTKAMEIVGGQGFYRSFGLERLFRDVHAAHYHPLQEKDQHQFSGDFILRD